MRLLPTTCLVTRIAGSRCLAGRVAPGFGMAAYSQPRLHFPPHTGSSGLFYLRTTESWDSLRDFSLLLLNRGALPSDLHGICENVEGWLRQALRSLLMYPFRIFGICVGLSSSCGSWPVRTWIMLWSMSFGWCSSCLYFRQANFNDKKSRVDLRLEPMTLCLIYVRACFCST